MLALYGLLVLLAGCAGMGPAPSNAPAGAVLATIPVEGQPPTFLAMAPDGSRVYAATSGRLSVIDTASDAVVATVGIDPYPVAITVTPDGTRALVTNLFSFDLTVVDLRSNTRLPSIPLLMQRQRGGYGRVAVSPDGRSYWVTNGINEILAVVTVGQQPANSRLMDMRPADVTFSSDGARVFVAGCKDFCTTGTVEILDPTSQRVRATWNVGPSPYRILLSPDGSRAYTTNVAGPSASVVDTQSGATIATVPLGPTPTGLAVSPDGRWVAIASQVAGALTVIDGATGAVRATTNLGGALREVVIAPDGRRLWVSSGSSVLALDAAAVGAAQ